MSGKIKYFILASIAATLLGGCSKSESPKDLNYTEPTVESKQELQREEFISEIESILKAKPKEEREELISEIESILKAKPKEEREELISEIEKIAGDRHKKGPLPPQTEERYLDEMIDYSLQYIGKGNFSKAQETLNKNTYDKHLRTLQDIPDKKDAHKYFKDMREMILRRTKTFPTKADEAAKKLDQILYFSSDFLYKGNTTLAKRFLKSGAYNRNLIILADIPGSKALYNYFTDMRNQFVNRSSGNYKDTIPSTGWPAEPSKK